MPKVKYFSQEVLSKTFLFGKIYYWMKDVDGTIYLVKSDNEGNPVF